MVVDSGGGAWYPRRDAWSAWFSQMVLLGTLCSCLQAGLQADIDALVSAQRGVDFGICVLEGRTGELLYGRQAHEPLTPASNMKIVTSATALQYLGPDYRFVTRVGLAGGRLIVVGAGDPLLGDPESLEVVGREEGEVLRDIADRLLARGIHRVEGIVVDSSLFDDERVHPNWPEAELNRAYAAEVCGLNYYGNRMVLRVSREGGRIDVVREPDSAFLRITNTVRLTNGGSGAVEALRKAGQPNAILLRGKVRRSQGLEVAIERPASFFGVALAEVLRRRGIAVHGDLVERPWDGATGMQTLAEYETPIQAVLTRCNRDSFNLAAECLLKTVAAHATQGGRYGSWTVGRRVEGTFLRSLGIAEEEFAIDDGCGLSEHNRLSPFAIARTLQAVTESDLWPMYRQTLAVAGVDGTLNKTVYDVLDAAPYRGHILAKSGYIAGVKSLSGVCLLGDRRILFSLLANRTRPDTRAALVRIAKAVFDNG